ncbi:hypothetical protein PLA107_033035 (plasmid) [Pseudomonas amygdali pv. lachrymans str. M301315]|uniref:Uncharacterized protein n=3 Tax=Pseudomonas amygdali TaxID=47877 RepID=A0AAD0V9W8_PSEAV|nr:hypothetical protein PLA107_033035 [Pseudomonas amygdali pv. lachrymans str. M301315]RMT05882.1 hypothetical protein ALP54_03905 [Pseudomonas amygdali pv. lachrymans]
MPQATPMSKEDQLAYIMALPQDEMLIMARYLTRDPKFLESVDVRAAKLIEKHLVELGLAEAQPSQTDDERISMWADYGLKVSVPQGRCEFSDSLMLAEHGGVPYCVDEHSDLIRHGDSYSIERSIINRQGLIDGYHDTIKSVYNYCLSLGKGPAWVMVGTAPEQVFFGYDQGYFAILYLEIPQASLDPEAQHGKINKRKHSLVPQYEKHEPLFERLKLPGVKVSLFGRSPSP